MTPLATQGAFGHPSILGVVVFLIFVLLLNIPGLIQALRRKDDD
jgi:hypothetical protein